MGYKNRIALFDNLKFFLIFLVVLGHLTIQYYNSSQMFGTMTMVIYTFHMPAFIFVSGLFSKRGINNKAFPMKRVLGFIELYLITRVLNYGANIIFGVHSEFDIFSVKGVAWYMMAMAIWYALTWVLKNIDTKYILITTLIIACFVGYLKNNTDFLCIERVITFYPFFYCGYIMDSKKVEEVTRKFGSRIFSAIYFSAFIVIVSVLFPKIGWLYPLLSARQSYLNLEYNGDFGALFRLAYYVIVSLLIFSIISLCPRKEFKISKFGSRTMQIYILHRPIIFIMKNAGLFYLIRLVGEGWEWIAIAVIVLLLFALCPKVFSKPFDYLMKPKERDYEKIK